MGSFGLGSIENIGRQKKHTFKVLLLGEAAVGKTSLILRFVKNVFNKRYVMTIGMEPYGYDMIVDGLPITLQIWDIAGQEKFAKMRSIFFKGAKGAMLVYDITRVETFKRLTTWINDAKKYNQHLTFVVVGNKSDLEDFRQVPQQEGLNFAKEQHSVSWIETSAKNGDNVHDAFYWLAKGILEDMKKRQQTRQ